MCNLIFRFDHSPSYIGWQFFAQFVDIFFEFTVVWYLCSLDDQTLRQYNMSEYILLDIFDHVSPILTYLLSSCRYVDYLIKLTEKLHQVAWKEDMHRV